MNNNAEQDRILVLDCGSQYTHLIARRVREQGVFGEIVNAKRGQTAVKNPAVKGIILSGGPASVYETDAIKLPDWVLESGLPVLGVCYGMQLLAQRLGAEVAAGTVREYGKTNVTELAENKLLEGLEPNFQVWMSHGDYLREEPPDCLRIARSDSLPVAAFKAVEREIYGIQFHPEVTHTPQGDKIIANFLFKICDCSPNWVASNQIEQMIADIQKRVGDDGKVICGISGGVDSTVTAALLQRAIGDRLRCVFIDNGLLRVEEAERVKKMMQEHVQADMLFIDASEQFLEALKDVTDPDEKRKRIGATFIEVFDREASKWRDVGFLAQGTLYPDVIESEDREDGQSKKIKNHHNVGGLPEKMNLRLVEPLRLLFKDEVRELGVELGLPRDMVYRHPFPGPGLAIRVIGEVTKQRLEILRKCDYIVIDELKLSGWYQKVWQGFAVLTNTRTVGVMGDYATYDNTVAIRAVQSDDAMTADWARLPYDLLATISSRIVNEVSEVNRVVFDITSKPPGTIEWE